MSADHTLTQLAPSAWERLASCAFELTLLDEPSAQGGSERERELRSWTLSAREVTLGTHASAQVRLSDPSVSRQHAVINATPQGHLITDQNSKNGLWVSGVRVKAAYLSSGQVIQLGRARLRYQLKEDQPVEHLLSKRVTFGRMIGESEKMRELFAQLEQIAHSEITLLIEGESGTGKELAAEGVHQRSPRAHGPFVVFDCSAVSPSLIESELFGHARGAFTGASETREGAFRRAEGGTLFLDELGELPLELQPRLLRALEQREIKPVGADRYQRVSVRVIAATNRDLLAEVEAGLFRADLYYRLAVIKLTLPPLRAHLEDIPLLVRHFLDELSPMQRREVSYEAMLKLQQQPWKGNIRELKNFVQRALALSAHAQAHLETRFLLPQELHSSTAQRVSELTSELSFEALLTSELSFKEAKATLIERFERLYWERLLERHQGNLSAAAREAGIHRKSAEYLIKKWGLRSPS